MEKINRNLALLPVNRREGLSEKQKRCVENYSNQVKLKAVIRWKPRLVAAGASVQALAEKLKKPASRLAEWMNFTHEPGEQNFLEVDAGIYQIEGKKAE